MVCGRRAAVTAQVFDHDSLLKRASRGVRHWRAADFRHESMGSATVLLDQLVEAEAQAEGSEVAVDATLAADSSQVVLGSTALGAQ